MNATKLVLAIVALVAAIAGGYWWGTQHAGKTETVAQSAAPAAQTDKRKILYYRNPMGLPDTSPTPKKDPMGMDYVPVYEGEEEPASATPQVRITPERVQRLGVRTEAATMRSLTRTVRAVGTLQVDERRIATVSPRFEGWIERLLVSTTGEQVGRGQALMEVYSPDLITAQNEYLIAQRGVEAVKDGGPDVQASMKQLMSSALARMRNWEIADRELQELQSKGTIKRTVTLRSPVAGVVVEKPALRGMRFMPGEALYKIADLSGLWLLAEVYEQDLGLVRPGQAAKITVNAFPGKAFSGKVAFFYPTVTTETRTGKVRIELANPGGLLKPAMYAQVELATGGARKVLAVPSSAVIDSGVRQIIFVDRGEGRFEPREVKTGARADEYIEIVEGVKEGETVVVAANFLIDAESNLKAALNAFQPAASAEPTAKPTGVGHRGEGTLDAIDPKTGAVSISHGPIATLKWPAMAMDFNVANPALTARVKPGTAIAFEFVERKPGDYVITRIEPKGGR